MSQLQEERLKEFAPDQPAKATFWRQGTEGTFYWRLLVPARHLPARVNSLQWSDYDKDPLIRQDGPAVWQFLGDLERTKFVAKMQAAGTRCLMEVDDNYLLPAPHVPGIGVGRSGWETTVRRSFEAGKSGYSHQAHRLILFAIDGLICSTDELANQYEGLVPAGITVCPNSVDPDDWEYVEHGHQDRPLVVGYAGSDSHRYDLSLVERALDSAWRHGASLLKFGAHQNPWRWPHEQVPWTDDLAAYRRSLQGLDIGLCPLKRSRWHDSKSDIKAMEYLMAGAIPIVQADSPVYSDWLSAVPSAATPKEWEKCLREVLSWDAEERHKVWQAGYDHLMQNKTIQKHIGSWASCILRP